MTITFRAAEQAEIDVLVNFIRQFYAIDHYPFDEQITRRSLADLLRNPVFGRVWLIEREKQSIGYIVLTFGFSLEFHGRDALLDELFVMADQRQHGVGKQALQFVIDECAALGIHALHLEVERSNVVGQHLYRKYGFKEHDRYFMTKWL